MIPCGFTFGVVHQYMTPSRNKDTTVVDVIAPKNPIAPPRDVVSAPRKTGELCIRQSCNLLCSRLDAFLLWTYGFLICAGYQDSFLPNIAPENRHSQKEASLPIIHFQVRAVSFREGIMCCGNEIRAIHRSPSQSRQLWKKTGLGPYS